MKSTQTFLSAKPSVKTDMIIQGYAHVAARLRLISIEMKILNAWVKSMPTLIANDKATIPLPEEVPLLIDTVDEYIAAGDSLTDAMVENALDLEEMTKAIQFYKQIDK